MFIGRYMLIQTCADATDESDCGLVMPMVSELQ